MNRIRQSQSGVPAFSKRNPNGTGRIWYDNAGQIVKTPRFKGGQEAYKKVGEHYVNGSGAVLEEISATEEPKNLTFGTASDWESWNEDWNRRLKMKEAERATVQKLTADQMVRQNQQKTAEVMSEFNKRQIEDLFLDSDTPEFEQAVIARVQKEYGTTSDPGVWSIVVTAERNERRCREAFSKMTVAEIRKTTAAQLSARFFVTPKFAQGLLNDIAFEELVAAHRVK